MATAEQRGSDRRQDSGLAAALELIHLLAVEIGPRRPCSKAERAAAEALAGWLEQRSIPADLQDFRGYASGGYSHGLIFGTALAGALAAEAPAAPRRACRGRGPGRGRARSRHPLASRFRLAVALAEHESDGARSRRAKRSGGAWCWSATWTRLAPGWSFIPKLIGQLERLDADPSGLDSVGRPGSAVAPTTRRGLAAPGGHRRPALDSGGCWSSASWPARTSPAPTTTLRAPL